MKTSHTPGPWYVHEEMSDVVCAGDEVLAEHVSPEDAALIASAPDLLDALKNLLAVHEREGGTKCHAGDIARAAIAKATGEAMKGGKQ